MSSQGVLPNEDHLKAIKEAPAPKDATTLHSFLGLTAWYSKFVQNYASLVEPMRDCLRDDVFTWTAAAQFSLDAVKDRIVNIPALAVFDPGLPTIVSTDASDYGLGAILTQLHPDKTERTVALPLVRSHLLRENTPLWKKKRWFVFGRLKNGGLSYGGQDLLCVRIIRP